MRALGLQSLTRRRDALECENRRLRRRVALALAAAVLAPAWSAVPRWGLAAGPPVASTASSSPTVTAERFVLRDRAGHLEASLGGRAARLA